jgi:predicted RND superfamily exporter protein
MGYKAFFVEISYEMSSMLPPGDSTYIKYKEFKKIFGEDGNVLFIGVKDPRLYSIDLFGDWYELTDSIKRIDGVKEVLSVARLLYLSKNNETKQFEFKLFADKKPGSQSELDSLIVVLNSYPFYDGLIYNKESGATIMAITLQDDKLNSKKRINVVNDIKRTVDAFSAKNNIGVHYSGLPYIRTKTTLKVKQELKLFVLLAMLVASAALFLFFRSLKAMLFPMLIVSISVVWALGLIELLGFKISLLTGIIPPLLIVIGVENCIFLLNKYHHEYRNHKNKVKALSRVVQRVGYANFLTNLATATGFATFIVTGNKTLVEFGLVASINIIFVFILSLFMIPILFSYLKPPKVRHLKHLDNKITVWLLENIVFWSQHKRRVIFFITLAILAIGIYGMTLLKTSGNIVSDISKSDPVYVDLMFFEQEFKGILPFEISIDTRKPKGVLRLNTLEKIDQFQDTLGKYPEFSKALSIAEVIKFARQAFYNGNPDYYDLPNNQEKNFIFSYVPEMEKDKKTILTSFVDTSCQKTRISVQVANIGTQDMQRIKDELQPKIADIFPPDQYRTEITGSSVMVLKGTQYLVRGLLDSFILAVVVISLLMALLFSSYKMVGISIITNLIPQFLTAALMGFFLITIKPSTVLIFSIALGISVDNTIQFLSRYRIALRTHKWNIRQSVFSALRETGYSMLYSSTVLFLGFAIFTLSSFGGTKAMGFLISFTLLTAMFSNLFILPSLLLSLDRWATTRSFKEPLIEILDEEEDIELNDIEIEGEDTRGSA